MKANTKTHDSEDENKKPSCIRGGFLFQTFNKKLKSDLQTII